MRVLSETPACRCDGAGGRVTAAETGNALVGAARSAVSVAIAQLAAIDQLPQVMGVGWVWPVGGGWRWQWWRWGRDETLPLSEAV